MQTSHILKKAILSEKAYKLMEAGIYTFLVDDRATKDEIAKIVAGQFNVKVQRVNVSGISAKQKRVGKTRNFVSVGGGKKAIVYLSAGESIAMLSPKVEGKKSKSKSNDKEDEKKEANPKDNK